MRYFPVFLDLAGRPVLVVGGGEVAARKVALLRESFRRLQPPGGEGLDLVVVVGADLADRTQAEVDRELRERVERVAGNVESRRTAASSPH